MLLTGICRCQSALHGPAGAGRRSGMGCPPAPRCLPSQHHHKTTSPRLPSSASPPKKLKRLTYICPAHLKQSEHPPSLPIKIDTPVCYIIKVFIAIPEFLINLFFISKQLIKLIKQNISTDTYGSVERIFLLPCSCNPVKPFFFSHVFYRGKK